VNRDLLQRVLPLHVACIGEWRGTCTALADQCHIIVRCASQLTGFLPGDTVGRTLIDESRTA